MRLVDRFLAGSFLRSLLVIIMILILLFNTIELLQELDEIGTGNYHFINALGYIIMTTPGRIFDLLPVAVMLAGITSLGILSDHNELLALQAAGLNNRRISRPILLTSCLLILLAALLAEFAIPRLELAARTNRLQAQAGAGILVTEKDLWLRHRSRLIKISRSSPYATDASIDIYERSPEGALVSYIYSPRARIINRRQWQLEDVEEKEISPEGEITTTHLPHLDLNLNLSQKQLTLLRLPPETLSPSRLIRYIRDLKARGQNAEHYTLVLWQKLCQPLATLAMMLFSLALVFGPTRSQGAGKRTTLATLFGIGIYLANQIIGNLGLLFNLHPALVTVLPVAVILGLSLWLQQKRAT
jgi:lipopolysaccharide export system permease protein